jgi:hypothetical protein
MAIFKAKLEGVKEEDKFILKMMYFGKSVKEQPFRFFNAFKTIEARDLKIEDKNGKVLERFGNGSISPKNTNETNTMISETKSFIYESRAWIEKFDEEHIILDFITASYLLKKGDPYYIYLLYLDEVTDKIEIVF